MSDIQVIRVELGNVVQAIKSRQDLAQSTRERYAAEVTKALVAGVSLADVVQVQEYARGLSETARRFLRAGLGAWADWVELQAKAGANPENVAAIQALVYRLEAMQEVIEVQQPKGEKLPNWLSGEEVQRLLDSCDRATVKGVRDRLALGLLVGAGLRREEAANLTFDQIETRTTGESARTILQILGKGAKSRTVPISYRLAQGVEEWTQHLEKRAGFVLRRVNKAGKVGDAITPRGLFRIVREHGQLVGLPTLAAHDLRRTFARLAWENQIPVLELARLLGHADAKTTSLYIGETIDLSQTASDFIPF